MNWKKKLLIGFASISLLLIIVAVGLFFYLKRSGGTLEGYQHDADIIRLNDIVELGMQIEEFHKITGRYPLQGVTELDNYVHIATPEQEKFISGGPRYSHKVTNVAEFRAELQSALGDKARLLFDPQKRPTSKPNFYIYMVKGDRFFLAVHVHNDFPFARKVAEHYYKVEISNVPVESQRIWTLRDLTEDKAFVDAKNEPLNRSGWFMHLREKQDKF